MTSRESETLYLTGPQLCARLGVTAMTLWRWLGRDDLDFPKPYYFGRNRYFRIAEIEAWERSRPRRMPPEPGSYRDRDAEGLFLPEAAAERDGEAA